MDIKSNIPELCKSFKITQVDFIRKLDSMGVSRNTAITVYKGGTNVRLDTFVAAVRAVGVSMDLAITDKPERSNGGKK